MPICKFDETIPYDTYVYPPRCEAVGWCELFDPDSGCETINEVIDYPEPLNAISSFIMCLTAILMVSMCKKVSTGILLPIVSLFLLGINSGAFHSDQRQLSNRLDVLTMTFVANIALYSIWDAISYKMLVHDRLYMWGKTQVHTWVKFLILAIGLQGYFLSESLRQTSGFFGVGFDSNYFLVIPLVGAYIGVVVFRFVSHKDFASKYLKIDISCLIIIITMPLVGVMRLYLAEPNCLDNIILIAMQFHMWWHLLLDWVFWHMMIILFFTHLDMKGEMPVFKNYCISIKCKCFGFCSYLFPYYEFSS